MSDVLKRVNEGYYEKQLSRFRNDAPFPTQLGIELLALVKQQAEEKQGLERRNNELIEGINHNNKEYGLIIDENEQLKRQNKRYEKTIQQAISHFNQDEHREGMKVLRQALQNK